VSLSRSFYEVDEGNVQINVAFCRIATEQQFKKHSSPAPHLTKTTDRHHKSRPILSSGALTENRT
jgi:hypothetical protein